MDSDLRAMWGFLVTGTFSLIGVCIHAMSDTTAGGITTTGTFFITLIVTAFSCAMFVAAFVSAAEYLKVQLRRNP